MPKGILATLGAGLIFLLLSPGQAAAQSSIQGTVTDSSGASMAGVTVEASSPALIERSKTVTTNGEGRYSVIDLRPGTYSVTFKITGFTTQKRDNVDVQAGTAVPVSVEMGVGSVGETVTVEANAIVVDVENATHQQVLTREIQDSIPAARNMQALGALVPGIKLRSGSGANPDVGGSQQMEQTYITGHGSGAVHTTVLLDGMNINSNYTDGTIQNYVDNSIIQQATYQTSGISAEVAAGGTLVNQIPKDGGNEFHGDVFLSGTGSGGLWQAQNISPALKARGVTTGNSIVHIEDFDGVIGGPILRNKLWFLTSARYQSTYDIAGGVFYPNGEPGVEDQYIKQAVARLSWQISSKDKFSGTYDRIQKFKGHQLTPLTILPNNPDISAGRRGPPLYYVAQGKWTRTQSPKMLIEAGFSTDVIHFSDLYQTGQEKVPFTPEWYAGASKIDVRTISIRSNAPPIQTYNLPDRRYVSAAVTYVTGSHNLKMGIQDGWGKNDRVQSMNADLYQNYRLGVPNTVTAYNTPVAIRQRVSADVGVFVTDTWHVKRLSITGGLRWEYERSTINASAINGGRFIGARSFNEINCDTIKGLGCWKTWSPRFGAVYDLFGTGKTAVKFGFGRYNTPQATGYIAPFNPMALSSDTRSWTDSNKDDIAQDIELGPTQNVNFGKVTNIATLDPNWKREFNTQFSGGVTHQLKNNVSVGMNWYRRTNHNQTFLQNKAVDLVADWSPFAIIDPIYGKPITAYTINSAAVVARPSQLYQTNADDSKVRNVYTGYEFGTTARLPHRGHMFGGWTIERQSDTRCDANIGTITANAITNSTVNDPNSLRFCDQAGLVPFRSDFKMAGAMPVRWGFEVSATWQNSPEAERYTNWDITRTVRYPTDCASCPHETTGTNAGLGALVAPNLVQTTLRIQLVPPGSRYQDRLNQLDLGVKRTFKIREKMKLQAQLDVFNALNASTVLVQSQALTTTIAPFLPEAGGGQPTQILQARLLRLAVQFHF